MRRALPTSPSWTWTTMRARWLTTRPAPPVPLDERGNLTVTEPSLELRRESLVVRCGRRAAQIGDASGLHDPTRRLHHLVERAAITTWA